MAVDKQRLWFGVGLGDWSGADVAATGEIVPQVVQADRDGLGVCAVADHPYFGQRLDAYAVLGLCLGQTSRISGVVTVTNLPSRPAPVLARTVTSLSALSSGRIVLGIGAGGSWDAITTLGVTRLTPAMAVVAMEEAITLVRTLSSGSEPVPFPLPADPASRQPASVGVAPTAPPPAPPPRARGRDGRRRASRPCGRPGQSRRAGSPVEEGPASQSLASGLAGPLSCQPACAPLGLTASQWAPNPFTPWPLTCPGFVVALK